MDTFTQHRLVTVASFSRLLCLIDQIAEATTLPSKPHREPEVRHGGVSVQTGVRNHEGEGGTGTGIGSDGTGGEGTSNGGSGGGSVIGDGGNGDNGTIKGGRGITAGINHTSIPNVHGSAKPAAAGQDAKESDIPGKTGWFLILSDQAPDASSDTHTSPKPRCTTPRPKRPSDHWTLDEWAMVGFA
ncbi:MAG: hypothetical protein AAF750_04845 [Planctomycetota bacterium]